MAVSSVKIANYFIRKAKTESNYLTQMKLLKLVYIAHGWHLALSDGEPLIEDDVQAWKHGPVIPKLYSYTKRFKANPISDELAISKNIFNNQNLDEEFLDQIWNIYSNFSGPQLSALTHQKGTAWDEVWREQGGGDKFGAVIPNNIILKHYSEKLKEYNSQKSNSCEPQA